MLFWTPAPEEKSNLCSPAISFWLLVQIQLVQGPQLFWPWARRTKIRCFLYLWSKYAFCRWEFRIAWSRAHRKWQTRVSWLPVWPLALTWDHDTMLHWLLKKIRKISKIQHKLEEIVRRNLGKIWREKKYRNIFRYLVFKHLNILWLVLWIPKFFWPTVRKMCSSDREKLLKFEAEGREFEKFWDH